MAHRLRVLVAGLLVVLVSAGTACADQRDEWNGLIEQWNATSEEVTALDVQGIKRLTEVDAIDPYAENAADALPLLAEAQALYLERTEKVESLVALCDQMADLDVSEERGVYAGQQKEIAETMLEDHAVLSELIARLQILYDASRTSTLSQTDLDRLEQEIDDLRTREEELFRRLIEMEKASRQYWEDNTLGGTD